MSDEEKKEMTLEEAEKLLYDWALFLEVNTSKKAGFPDVVNELLISVQKERLGFDPESEVFRYKLIKEVNGKSVVEIKETSFEDKRSIQKFQEDESMDAAGLLMAKHTNMTTAEILKMKTRDQNRINAVIMGFLSK